MYRQYTKIQSVSRTKRQKDIQTESWAYGHKDRQIGVQADIYGYTEDFIGHIDKQYGETDGRTDREIDRQLYMKTDRYQ